MKKKQSCNKNETDHKDKQFNDTSGKTKEVEGGKIVMKEKEDDDDNRDRDLAINNEEKVLKKNDKFSVNQNNENGNINVSEKCCNAYYENGSLQKNEVHQKKDSWSKEADSCMKGIAGIEKIKENLNFKDITEKEKDGLNNGVVQSSKAVSDDVDKKKNDDNIERVDFGNEVVGATKGKGKDIHNNNIESTKKDTEVPVKDVKNAKESDKKEERNKASSSNPNKNSPKKRQFGYNYRGRGFYGNSRGTGRNFEWRGGWGYNNYNNRFHNQRMMNSGPSSAYRGHRGDNHTSRNYRDSAPAHTKTPCPSHPEDILPLAFPGPLQPVYFNNQLNYQDCYYFPQLWTPQQSEQTLHGEAEATTYYQGSTEISSIQTEAAAHYDAEYIQSAEKAETNGMINLSHQQYLGNQLSGQTETSKEVNAPGHEKMSNIIASVSSNPLLDLGKSAEEDKQLVQTFAGIEMRPSIQLPPDYQLQWYFIQYGAALPQSVIPVMVVPYLNSADSVVVPFNNSADSMVVPFNNSADSMVVPFHNGEGNCNMYLAGQGGNCPQDQGFSSLQRHWNGGQHQGFPPPYFNNVDVPGGSAQTPSQVDQLAAPSTSRETYQPGVRTWPH